MKLYQATKEDVDGVVVLFNSYRMFYEQPCNMEGAEKFIQERIEKGDAVIYVAVQDDIYLGFVQLYPSFSSVSMKRTWILNDLYVLESARKQGVAQKLIDAAVDLCYQTNAKSLSLQTAPTNKTAQKLYEKNHFVIDDDFYNYTLTINS